MSKKKQYQELDNICAKALKTFGIELQFDKCKEECFELGQALCHYQAGKIGLESLMEELVDIEIITKQIKMYLNEPRMHEQLLNEKLLKLKRIINEAVKHTP